MMAVGSDFFKYTGELKINWQVFSKEYEAILMD